MRTVIPDATGIAERFALPSPVDSTEPYGNGLINDTFLVTAGDCAYILQRINGRVFPAPERIMANLAVLEEHLASQPGAGLRIPALIPSRDGLPFARGKNGAIWRLMSFISNAESHQRIDELSQAQEVGRILGRFHFLTDGLDPSQLTVTLPGFHVTSDYLDRFQRVLRDGVFAQSDNIRQAIAFIAARQSGTAILEEARQDGRIPVRVIHGDPKLDNILFDRSTGRAVSLIDLDTIQPGLVHYDLGDCLRSCCNRVGEYPGGGGDARFDLDLCRAILGAYANETRGMLGEEEIGSLFDAIRLIPFELGLRFLTDHLEGDRYFRVTERGQNLRKALIQFSLVEDIESKEPEIRGIIAECFRHLRNHASEQTSRPAAR
jgi:Ser/Thr protein kinase RdoA (MazF antagonist)